LRPAKTFVNMKFLANLTEFWHRALKFSLRADFHFVPIAAAVDSPFAS
jgi:hypothetical protein